MTLQPATTISHTSNPKSLEESKQELAAKIEERNSSAKQIELELLDALAEFPLGQFLIQNRGLNGYWTDVVISHKECEETAPSWEQFLFDHAPTVLATQQRFRIFQEQLQTCVAEGVAMASVPCGLMRDLLTLNFDEVNEVTLYGVDVDQDSLQQAKERAKENTMSATFVEGDAWSFELTSPVDVLTSNGLNIYERDDARVTALYQQFAANIKPGGKLITSFLTPPTAWDMKHVDQRAAAFQKQIFVDVIGATWQAFRTKEKTIEQLEAAGFKEIQVFPDKAGIFPTVVATRS